MRLPKPLLLAAPLAALAIAGCGGGGGDSTASTPATTETTAALSKADLIKQGDAICAEVNAAIGSVANTEASVPGQVTQVADLYTGMVESLKRLGPPEDASGYPEFIAAAEELAKVEGEAKLAAAREDTAALGEAATKATPALEEFETVAGEYGFEDCGEGPRAPTPSSGAAAGTGGEEAAEGSPEAIEEEVAPEVEEVAPETGGAGGAVEEVAPEGGGTGTGGGGGETGGSSGGIGPG